MGETIEGVFGIYSLTFTDPLWIGLKVNNGKVLEARIEDRKLKKRILSGELRIGLRTRIKGKVIRLFGMWVLEKGEVIEESIDLPKKTFGG